MCKNKRWNRILMLCFAFCLLASGFLPRQATAAKDESQAVPPYAEDRHAGHPLSI